MSSSLIVLSSLNYFTVHQLWVQIPCTCSLHTPQIYRTYTVCYFCRRGALQMFERILNAPLSSNLLQFAEDLRRSFPSLELHKGILDSTCLLILLITLNTSSIHFPETVLVSSDPTTITQIGIIPHQNKNQPPLA